MEAIFDRTSFQNKNGPPQFKVYVGATYHHPYATSMVVEANGYNFEIIYHSGKENKAAEALLRKEEETTPMVASIQAMALSLPIPNWLDTLK